MILVPTNHNGEMFICVMGGVITSVLLNFLLVPTYREVGSAVANVAAEVVVTSLYFYFIQKYFTFIYPWKLLLEAVLCSLAFIPVIWLFRQLHLPLGYQVVATIGGCGLAYMSMQLLFGNHILKEMTALARARMAKTSTEENT